MPECVSRDIEHIDKREALVLQAFCTMCVDVRKSDNRWQTGQSSSFFSIQLLPMAVKVMEIRNRV